MSSKPAIEVSEPELMNPLNIPMPMENSARWNSPYDESGLSPLVPVFVSQPAYSRICVHSVSDLKNEVGGILIGQWCLGPQHEQFVVVEHALPARHTRQGSAYLTFTPDSLVDIHQQIDSHYQGQKIVGWYHTHPSMGVFLSHYDTWLHRNFFPEPWQVALVVEPVTAMGGFFIRQPQGLLDPTRYFGFYELDGASATSMVYWNNLRQPLESKGEDTR